MTALLVALGGAAGAVLRHWVSMAVQRSLGPGFPWGTLAVNVSGCFMMGLVAGVAERQGSLTPAARLFLVVGVLGGFTTFSAFANETVGAARAGAMQVSIMNVLGSVGSCLAAVWLGRLAAALWAR
jgi:CrcB protein